MNDKNAEVKKFPVSSPSRHAALHRNMNKTSKSKLARNSSNRIHNSKFLLLHSFPPRTISVFPSLTSIRTLSNTRIDKLGSSSQVFTQGQGQEGQLLQEPSQQNNHLKDNDVEFLVPEDPTPIMTKDSDFSYDYETYMMHVTKSRRDISNNAYLGTKNYDKNCNLIPDTTVSSYNNASWIEDCGKRSAGPLAVMNSSFGLDLLDLSESLVVRLCSKPTSVVTLAFRRSGTIPIGPIYEVSTKSGSPMLYMTETTNCLTRLLSCSWIGCSRLLTAHIVDVCGKLAMTVTNAGIDCGCCCCLFCCCSWWYSNSREFRVNLANGDLLGTVCQTRGDRCNPGFLLRDSHLRKTMNVDGPKFRNFDKLSTILSVLCCCFSCLIDDDVFYFTEPSGKGVAEIRKVVPTYSDENDSGESKKESNVQNGNDGDSSRIQNQDDSEDLDSDLEDSEDLEFALSYEIMITFSPNLSLKKKALILFASFVIDFLYWQSSSDSY